MECRIERTNTSAHWRNAATTTITIQCARVKLWREMLVNASGTTRKVAKDKRPICCPCPTNNAPPTPVFWSKPREILDRHRRSITRLVRVAIWVNLMFMKLQSTKKSMEIKSCNIIPRGVMNIIITICVSYCRSCLYTLQGALKAKLIDITYC